MTRLVMAVLLAGACGKGSADQQAPAESARAAPAAGSARAPDPAPVSAVPHTQQAVVELANACDSGHSDACIKAGMAYLAGDGVAIDPARGRTLFERGCEGGSQLACAQLARMYRDAAGIPFDVEKAFAYAVKACGAFTTTDAMDAMDAVDRGFECMSAARAARTGRGTKPDVTRASELEATGIQFYEAACASAPAHCRNLAIAYERAEGVAGDQAKARELYTKACDAGDFGSCSNLGALWKQGLGGAKDVAKAAALFTKACHGGVTTACPFAK